MCDRDNCEDGACDPSHSFNQAFAKYFKIDEGVEEEAEIVGEEIVEKVGEVVKRDKWGKRLCEHNRVKTKCKECGGSSICEHGRIRSRCKECGGSSICKHNIIRSICKECGGASICEHNKNKSICKECGGSQICKHGRRKSRCKECKGGSICEHNRIKSHCKECGGSSLCKTPLCETMANKKFQGYCYRCFIQMFPDNQIVRNHKTKERNVADYIREQFPNYTITLDKRISDGCSARKPDIFIDFGEYVLIIEIDENQHRKYDCSCEDKRLMILFRDAGSRPMVMIRFNPDQYYDKKGKSIASCWGYTIEKGLCRVKDNKKKEWQKRLETLKEAIELQINYSGERKDIDVIHLFYDENL